MRLVVDTNVLISALLTPGRTPDRALTALIEREDVVLYDERIVAEYREVLGRKKFRHIEGARIDALIAALMSHGEIVAACAPFDGELIDTDDRLFVEVALAGRADAIVTGNVKHYPIGLGFDVLPPALLLARFGNP